MCVFCNGFRNRIRGYEELDNKVIGTRGVRVGVEIDHGNTFLLVTEVGTIVSATPIAYCPLCGEKIGGKKNDKDRK